MIFNEKYVRGVVVQELKEDLESLRANIDKDGNILNAEQLVEHFASEMLAAFEAHGIIVVKSSPLDY